MSAALLLSMLGLSLVATALLRYAHGSLAVWWPTAGLGLAVLARSPRSWWRYEIAAIVASLYVLSLLDHADSVFGAAYAVGNGLECYVAASIFRGRRQRDRPGTDLPPTDLLVDVRDLIRLVVATVCGTVATATVLGIVLSIESSNLLVPLTRIYVGDHLLGVLEMTPLLLLPTRSVWRSEVVNVRRNLEWTAQLGVSIAAAYAVFVSDSVTANVASCVVFPLMWGAVRLGPLRAMVSVLTVSTIATVATVHGDGPLSVLAQHTSRVWVLQLSLALLSLSTLVLVLAAQRRERSAAELARRSSELADAQTFASIGSWSMDLRTGDVRWSSEMFRILGTDEATFAPDAAYIMSHVLPEDMPKLTAAIGPAMESGAPWDVECRVRLDDGRVRVLHDCGRGEFVDGALARLTGVVQDVTASRQVAHELSEARDHLAGVLDGATEQGIISADLHGAIRVFNVGAQRMFGYTEDEAIGMHVAKLHDIAEVVERARELGIEPGFEVFVGHQRRTGQAETRTWTLITKDGKRLKAALTISMQFDETGQASGFIGLVNDITEQVRAQRALAQSEQRFRLAFDTAPVGMAIVDLSDEGFGRLLQVNPVMSDLTGLTDDELLHKTLIDVSHPDEVESSMSALTSMRDGEVSALQLERRLIRHDGRTVWAQLSMSTVSSDDEKPYVICLIEDVTDRRRAEQLLRHQSQHDALTGLANRHLLAERLEGAIGEADERARVGVLYIDLDGFKAVNDGSGHAAGDELLCQVATRLAETVRPGDVVARIGGDEFAVLCKDVADCETLQIIAERIVATLRVDYVLSQSVHHISASVGVSLSEPGLSADDLLRCADDAMYEAKHGGKDRLAVFPLSG